MVRYVAANNLRQLPGFQDFEYNFLGQPRQLRRAVDRAVAQWQRQDKPEISANPELLLHGRGEIMEDKLKILLDQQDQRPVTIEE